MYVVLYMLVWVFPPFFSFIVSYYQQLNLFHTKLLCSLTKKISVICYLIIKVYLIMIFKIQEKFKSEFLAVENNTALDFYSQLIFITTNLNLTFKICYSQSSLNCSSCQALLNNPVRSQISKVMIIWGKKKRKYITFQEKEQQQLTGCVLLIKSSVIIQPISLDDMKHSYRKM